MGERKKEHKPSPRSKPSSREGAAQRKRSWPLALKLWLIAALLGLIVGGAVIAFRMAILFGENVFYNSVHENVASAASQLPVFYAIIAPIVGGTIVGFLLWVGSQIGWGDQPKAFSVADVMKARRYPNRIDATGLTVRDGLLSAAISAISLSAGSSTGREGPAVHLGAMIARLPARLLTLDVRASRTLLGCGAAAAVSASFHAPLAGVLFAREVILQRYRIADIGPVAVSSVIAALFARSIFGNRSVYVTSGSDLDDPYVAYFLTTPILGLFAAGLAIMAIYLWSKAPTKGIAFAEHFGLPIWALPPLGGLVLGLFGIAFPQILGVGYESTAAALSGGYGALFMIVLVFAKLAATSLCLGARFGGGVFSPAIYIGAMMGGAFGFIVGWLTGDVDSGVAFFTIAGMGAVSGAVLGAPVSTTLIVFELTSSYETAAAVLVSVSLATVLVQSQGGGLFERQLKQRMRQSY